MVQAATQHVLDEEGTATGASQATLAAGDDRIGPSPMAAHHAASRAHVRPGAIAEKSADSEPVAWEGYPELFDEADENNGPEQPDYTIGYDGGFVIESSDTDENPFELKINGRLQLRHTGFQRSVDSFTDLAGNVEPVRSRNDFEIERGRLEFRAMMLDPKLHYYLNIDFDTDDNHRLVAHDVWANYEFSEAFDLHVGKSKVPGSRAWLLSSSRFRFADRSMATTFFRPDRSVGVWAWGEPTPLMWYEVFVGNGFATTDQRFDTLDEQFVFAGSAWWHPLGDFGKGYTDLEYHCDPVIEIGHSFTYVSDQGIDGQPVPEVRAFSLSDGTGIITTGALAPGATVQAFDAYLYAVDFGFKYRGFSFNTEWYFRWLQSIRADMPLPLTKLMDHGFFADVGWFLVPKRFELIGRVSQVDGFFGDGWEYAGGFNWYVNGSHRHKWTVDISVLNGNPAESSSPNLIAGADGTMVRTQWQVAF